jgi:hypothetical protein
MIRLRSCDGGGPSGWRPEGGRTNVFSRLPGSEPGLFRFKKCTMEEREQSRTVPLPM